MAFKVIPQDVRDRSKTAHPVPPSGIKSKELISKMREGVLCADFLTGEILDCNPALLRMFGYAKKRFLIGLSLADLHPSETASNVRAMYHEFPRGVKVLADVPCKKSDGSVFRADLEVIRSHSSSGNTLQAIFTSSSRRSKLVDELMASKKEVEELYDALREAYKGLKEAQEELVQREKETATGEFAAGVAHEIRNPLSIINMSVQYIQSKLGRNDPLREFAEAVIEKVNRLDRITKELVEYGKPRELELRSVDLLRLIGSSLRLASACCFAQGVRVHRDFPSSFPKIKADPERLDEVFSNMITNALDAMPKGGHLTVRVREDLGEEQAVIEIANTEKGIPPQKRARLFTPFFTTKPNGTGLGLPICQRIVSQHLGSISVGSKISGPHKGTRFIIRLPMDLEKKGFLRGGAVTSKSLHF